MEYKHKLWRSLACIISVKEHDIFIVIPSYSMTKKIRVDRSLFPHLTKLKKRLIFFCMVNLDCEDSRLLQVLPPIEIAKKLSGKYAQFSSKNLRKKLVIK